MAALIAENSYLIPDYVKEAYAKKNRSLMIVTDLETEMEQEDNEVLKKLDMIKKNVFDKIGKIDKKIKNIKKAHKKQSKQKDRQENDIKYMIAMLKTIPGVNLNESKGAIDFMDMSRRSNTVVQHSSTKHKEQEQPTSQPPT